jgi:hypothetical protein
MLQGRGKTANEGQLHTASEGIDARKYDPCVPTRAEALQRNLVKGSFLLSLGIIVVSVVA